jgi:hypothetical protein
MSAEPGWPIEREVQGHDVVNGGHGHDEAAVSGLGIGRATDPRVASDIRAGRLRPLPEA